MRKYQSMYHNRVDYVGEVNTADSLTIPDETLTPREILESWMKGKQVQEHPVTFGVNDDLDHPNRFDTGYDCDKMDLLDELRNARQERQKILKESDPVPIAPTVDSDIPDNV